MDTADLNGDGYQDVVASTPATLNENKWAGVAYVGLGPIPQTERPIEADGLVYLGMEWGDRVGAGAAAGDIDGDGQADLLLGVHAYTSTDMPGRVHLFYGPLSTGTPLDNGDWVVVGPEASDGFSNTITVGDFNADGLGDIAVGAPYTGSETDGAIYIFCGADI
jgi:hypothetical protein